MRILPIIAMALLLSGCGSIISRTVPGQGHGNQYYPGVQWDVRDSAWRYLTVLDLPFSLVFDTLLLRNRLQSLIFVGLITKGIRKGVLSGEWA